VNLKITEHGGGARGVRGCKCQLCKDQSNRWTREFRAGKKPRRAPCRVAEWELSSGTIRRRVSEWELWDSTPTRTELLTMRGMR
jgi:hypothetical protein